MKLIGIGDLFTLEGAAKALGVSYRRMWLYCKKRNVVTVQLGKSRLIHVSDVMQFQKELENAKQPPTAA